MPLFLLSVAFLLCARFVSGSEVRLLGGKHAYEGRVEVLHNEEWRAICDHGWNFKAAKVVCRNARISGRFTLYKRVSNFIHLTNYLE